MRRLIGGAPGRATAALALGTGRAQAAAIRRLIGAVEGG